MCSSAFAYILFTTLSKVIGLQSNKSSTSLTLCIKAIRQCHWEVTLFILMFKSCQNNYHLLLPIHCEKFHDNLVIIGALFYTIFLATHINSSFVIGVANSSLDQRILKIKNSQSFSLMPHPLETPLLNHISPSINQSRLD